MSAFGRLDVLVNKAGYGSFGAVEEVTEAEARAQMEPNLFDALWMTQAVLPIMREQKFGCILMLSSIGGVAAFPNLSLYHASKWALEGLSDSFALEVAPFGFGVTLVKPCGHSTDWSDSSAEHVKELPAYAEMYSAAKQRSANLVKGDPEATTEAILMVVDSPEPPLRIFFGTVGLPLAKQKFAERLQTWEKWADISNAAQEKAQPVTA